MTTRLLLLCILVPALAVAQNDFRKGYAIKNSGDSINGFVNYSEDGKAYRVCEFRLTEDGKATQYAPDQLVRYGFVNDRSFESTVIPTKGGKSERAFLEVLARGPATLYEYNNSSYWIRKGSGELKELIDRVEDTYVNGVRVMKHSNEHIAVLNQLLFDCEDVQTSIKRATVNQKTLTRLVERYNSCNSTSTIAKEKKPWLKVIPSISAAVNYSTLSFDVENHVFDFLQGDFQPYTSPLYGIGLEVLSPRISERFSLTVGASYMSATYYRYSEVPKVLAIYNALDRNYVTLELQQFKIPTGILYTFPEKTFTPFIDLGLSATRNISYNYSHLLEEEVNSIVYIYNPESLKIKKTQFGFWGGIGVLKSLGKKFALSFEARFEQTNGVVTHLGYSYAKNSKEVRSKITNLQLILALKTK